MTDPSKRVTASNWWRLEFQFGALALTVGVLIAATSSLGLVGNATAATPKAPSATNIQYYVAMGDSLGAGYGASQPANGYVNLVYQHELAQYPNLQLVNLSQPEATTDVILHGPQLSNAEAFLRAHAGQVALLTIDIGGNDVDNCVSPSGIDGTCIQNGVNQIATNLPAILHGLRASYSGLPIYGMDYYDPFLAYWLNGASGQVVAQQSENDAAFINALFGQIYAAAAASMADPATLFETGDFALTGSWNGTVVPQNVALICEWTNMCPPLADFHANDAGHAELAAAFEQVIGHTPSPVPTTTLHESALPTPAALGQPVTYSVTVDGLGPPPGTVPSGSVTFRVGAASLCTATLSPTAADLTGGSGSCNSSNAPPGMDTVTATYGGDSFFTASSGTAKMTITNATPSVTCSSVSGNAFILIRFKTCSPFSRTNKSASAHGSFLASGGALTWAHSFQSTTASVTQTSVGLGGCKSGSTEHDVTGIVTGGTSTYTRTYDPVSLRVCETGGGTVSLAPGSSASF
jgi:lysophospholipase L1-like esterase